MKKVKDPSPARKKRLLVVDDDAFSIFLCETALHNYFIIDSVYTGYEAIKCTQHTAYDAILMDIYLGEEKMDGVKTMRIIRQNAKKRDRVPIFAVTTLST